MKENITLNFELFKASDLRYPDNFGCCVKDCGNKASKQVLLFKHHLVMLCKDHYQQLYKEEKKFVEEQVEKIMTPTFLKNLKKELDKAEETLKNIDQISKIDHQKLLEPFDI